ncbi:MAG: hypothetical protein G3M70_14390 [Candidatus Nitronauta litoralis]|uniref:Uncharacterized protein n=1 Tax=Candidatus Nitronauta litoralis TaxID=2705533 RepID=A0A7T0G152_9BACT|nr:MAG: hypothetical protein G3M70_14390 [Candidatus Nitronauta litoralis]
MDNSKDDIPDLLESLLVDGRFLPTYPFDLNQSLKIRDGLKDRDTSSISRHVLQELQIKSLKSREICLN